MFLILFVVLLVAWILGFVAFHVAGGLIHLLLIIAVISLILHFVRGRHAVVLKRPPGQGSGSSRKPMMARFSFAAKI